MAPFTWDTPAWAAWAAWPACSAGSLGSSCSFGTPFTPCAPLTLTLSAILLLPNALCYFLIITQVTCKWKVKGLPRRRRGRPHPVSGSGCGQDTNSQDDGRRTRVEDDEVEDEAGLARLKPPIFIFLLQTFYFFSSCNDAGKFAGNNFNCVNCAVSCPVLFARSTSLSVYLSLSISFACWLLQSLAFSGIPDQLYQQRPSCGKIKLLIRSVGQGYIYICVYIVYIAVSLPLASRLDCDGFIVNWKWGMPRLFDANGTRFPLLSRGETRNRGDSPAQQRRKNTEKTLTNSTRN